MSTPGFLLMLFLAGCGTATSTRDHKGESLPPADSVAHTMVAPIRSGTCRIVGRLVAVDSSSITTDSTDPCSRTPCRGLVVVEEMLGIGTDFPHYLIQRGDRITITFPGTLLPHDEHFNGMLVNSYPGLNPGDRFRADVALEIADGLYEDPANDGALTVYSYAVER